MTAGRGSAGVRAEPVLETRLRPPARGGALVDRPRLAARLARCRESRLTLVAAPAGYGKTSLLTQCFAALRAEGAAACWLSIDATDEDPARLVRHLVAALATAVPGFGAGLDTIIPGAGSPTGTAVAFANACAALPRDLFVCIDDLHRLREPEAHALLETLVAGAPHNLHLLAATREAPAWLPLARLRVAGELVELGPADLQFSDAECEALLRHAQGVRLGPAQARELNRRTEGWVAALQLAAITLRDRADQDGWLRTFSGGQKAVGDFLASEVLERQRPEVRDFLLATSILERFDAALAAEISGRADAHAILAELEQANLFLFSLDEAHAWYRYHHLFSGFLRARLAARDPAALRGLHLRACEWLDARGHASEALEHALAAAAHERAAQILDGLTESLFAAGEVATLEGYMARLPPDVLARHPRILLDRVWQMTLCWQFAQAAQEIATVATTLRDFEGAQPPARSPAELRYLRGKLEHREVMLAFISDSPDVAATESACQRWLAAAYPPDPAMHMPVAIAVIQLAAQRDLYRLWETRVRGDAIAEICERHGIHYGDLFHHCMIGASLFVEGDLASAEDEYRTGLDEAVRLTGEGSRLAAMPALLLAELCYEQNRLDEARLLTGRYLDVAGGIGIVEQLVAGYVTAARLAWAAGHAAGASGTLEAARRRALATGFTRLHAHAVEEELREAALAGDRRTLTRIGRAEGLLRGHVHLLPNARSTVRDEIRALAWSRVAAAGGDIAGAQRLLKRWLEFVAERRCARSIVRLGAALAAVCQRAGEPSAAAGYLRQALEAGARGGFARTYLDEGPALGDVLEAIAPGVSADLAVHVESLRRAFAALAGPVEGALPAGPPALAPREVEILLLAADDRGNADIATTLALSANTVKWYWQQVFQKLGVRRRAQAVRKARDLGLLP